MKYNIFKYLRGVQGRIVVTIALVGLVLLAYGSFVFIQARRILSEFSQYNSFSNKIYYPLLSRSQSVIGQQYDILKNVFLIDSVAKEKVPFLEIDRFIALNDELIQLKDKSDDEDFNVFLRRNRQSMSRIVQGLQELKIASLKLRQLEGEIYALSQKVKRSKSPDERQKYLSEIKILINGRFEKAVGEYWAIFYGDNVDKTLHTLKNNFANETKSLLFELVWIITSASILAFGVLLYLGRKLIYTFRESLRVPLDGLHQVAVGKTNISLQKQNNEFDSIIDATEQVIHTIRSAGKFALEIGEGNFNAEYVPAGEHDELGNALLKMKIDLQSYAIREKQLQWASSGEAHFSAIIRNNIDRFDQAAEILVSELVNYIQADQGAIYIADEQSKQLTMQACYAYKRLKHFHRTSPLGDGYLGQVYLDGEPVYINDVPKDYLRIASGLGDALPACVFICPLKTESKVVGVVELASFKEFEPHVQAFVVRISGIIASAAEALIRNTYNRKLLDESRQLTQELKSQEEELRQNYEELMATQEEWKRRESSYLEKIDALQRKLSGAR